MRTLSSGLQIRTPEDLSQEIKIKQDEFLDVYSFYRQTGIAWIHDELKLKAYELHLLDPAFGLRV